MIALMALVGGLGAVCRFVTDGEIKARTSNDLPLATLVINLVGSLLLGGLTAMAVRHLTSPDVRLVLGTGFCGGFTTFSTAMVDAVRLADGGRRGHALGYLLVTALGCLGCAAAGYLLVA